MKDTQLAIAIPCYNESESLPKTIERLNEVLEELIRDEIVSPSSFLYFVDDGSSDDTWSIIQAKNEENPVRFKGQKFTRNFGNQSALIAGLEGSYYLGADAIVTIDADLQQDENKIREFVQKFDEGYEIVAGVRADYTTESWFKNFTSGMFYKTMNLLGSTLTPNHSEYRLVSKRAMSILSSQYRETNLFIRCLFFEFGLKTAYVEYEVKKREFGESKFNLISLMRLAAYGIVSFSTRPLRFVFFTGLLLAGASMLFAIYGIIKLMLQGSGLHFIEPFEIFVTFMFGFQLLCIGIIGEYIGQMFQEVKARPRYITDIEVK